VEGGINDSKFEPVDVSDWLDEADQIDRVRKLSDPETRQFQLEQVGEQSSAGIDESGELSVSESTADSIRKRPDKNKKPGKLPDSVKREMTDNSRDAADNALKRFFSGR
jgi:hypothetical protein